MKNLLIKVKEKFYGGPSKGLSGKQLGGDISAGHEQLSTQLSPALVRKEFAAEGMVTVDHAVKTKYYGEEEEEGIF